jgi:hypothetical protein
MAYALDAEGNNGVNATTRIGNLDGFRFRCSSAIGWFPIRCDPLRAVLAPFVALAESFGQKWLVRKIIDPSIFRAVVHFTSE